MTFASDSQTRLVGYLNLPKTQDTDDSMLKRVMDDAVQFDTQHNRQYVQLIEELMDSVDTKDAEIQTVQAESEGIQRESVEGDYSVTYDGTGSQKYTLVQERDRLIQRIKFNLDPNQLLERFYQGGRVETSL